MIYRMCERTVAGDGLLRAASTPRERPSQGSAEADGGHAPAPRHVMARGPPRLQLVLPRSGDLGLASARLQAVPGVAGRASPSAATMTMTTTGQAVLVAGGGPRVGTARVEHARRHDPITGVVVDPVMTWPP